MRSFRIYNKIRVVTGSSLWVHCQVFLKIEKSFYLKEVLFDLYLLESFLTYETTIVDKQLFFFIHFPFFKLGSELLFCFKNEISNESKRKNKQDNSKTFSLFGTFFMRSFRITNKIRNILEFLFGLSRFQHYYLSFGDDNYQWKLSFSKNFLYKRSTFPSFPFLILKTFILQKKS